MKPMFLEGIEQAPGSGPHAEAVRMMQSAGMVVPQILHLFKHKPEATEHLARFTQAVMRGPSPLEPGMRELIAAFTSAQNHCPF